MRISRIDRAAWAVSGVLMAAILATILVADLESARVLEVGPRGGGVGPFSPLLIRFAQPMVDASVARRLAISPPLAGRLEWRGAEARFFPNLPWPAGAEVRARLEAGALSADLRRVEAAREWSFVVRQPSLIYLSPVVGQPEIWRQSFEPGSGQPVQLTHTQGGVTDFAPSPDGERIGYARSNDQGGSDLWIIDRSGADPRLVVDCGPDLCWGPAWSRTEPRLAFARETAGLAPGTPSYPPRIWILELEAGISNSLYPPDSSVIGFDPSWSPDGSRLAFYDGNAPGIRVLDWNSREEIVLPSNNGVGASWSSDGQELFFTGLSQFGPSVAVTVYRFSFLDNAVTAFLVPDETGGEYGLPAMSPMGDQVLLTALSPSSVGKQLILVDDRGASRQFLAQEPESIHGGYEWDPWGTWIVFQRFPLLSAGATPSVYVVQAAGGEARRVAEGAYRPAWLP